MAEYNDFDLKSLIEEARYRGNWYRAEAEQKTGISWAILGNYADGQYSAPSTLQSFFPLDQRKHAFSVLDKMFPYKLNPIRKTIKFGPFSMDFY